MANKIKKFFEIEASQWIKICFATVSGILIFCSSETNYLPDKMMDYTLYERLTGAQAKARVNRLHQSEVTEEGNEIGLYRAGNDNLTIYVTKYINESLADTNFRRMTQKISPQKSIFIGGEYLKIGEKEIFRCFGMGQTHFVFTHRKNLFWMSVNTISAERILHDYLDLIT
jgi:hypothetical protein